MNDNNFCILYIIILCLSCILFYSYFFYKMKNARSKFVTEVDRVRTEITADKSYYKNLFGMGPFL